MARIRQSGGASGLRKVPRSLWERAGARAGDGAGALFASLDAQDAQATAAGAAPLAEAAPQPDPAREQGARALERLAARIRAGAWSAEIAALVARVASLLAQPDARPGSAPTRGDRRA